MTSNIFSQSLNITPESALEAITQSDDSTTVSICPDLNELTATIQQDYSDFKHGLPSNSKSLNDYDPAAVYTCGSFTIVYADIDQNTGEGFDDGNLGAARRNTLCAVLNYVEDVLYVHPNANPVIFVDLSLSPNNPAPSGTGYLAAATTYHSLQTNHHYGVDPGIYDGFVSDYIRTGNDPDPNFDFDGYLITNFYGTTTYGFSPISYFNYGDPLVSSKKYDLFTTLLHEVTHMLGFASAMGESTAGNLVCKNQGNSYNRFDYLFGYYGDILTPSTFTGKKLLIGTEANPIVNGAINNISYPLRRANVWINNQGPPSNHLLFAGDPPVIANSGPNAQGNASILSHFGGSNIFPTRQQFSPGKYINYVMNYSIGTEELRREWTLPEIRMILELGYSLNQVFASSTTLSPPNTNAQLISNSPPYRNDYNSALDFLCLQYFFPTTDLLSFPELRNANSTIVNSNTTSSPNASSLQLSVTSDGTLEDNDNDNISVLPETVFGIRGVSDGGNNHNRLQLIGGTVFKYTPEPGFYGRAEFGFQLWDGKELGAMEIYTIDVMRDPNITYGQNDEMVINGDFEDGTESRTWENPEKTYTTKNSFNQPNLYFGLLQAGAHPYGMMGLSNTGGNVLLHSLDNLFPSDQNPAFGYYGYYFNTCPIIHIPSPSTTDPNNTRYFEYAPGSEQISQLKFAMIPGENYKLDFELAFPDEYSGGNIFDIGDVLNDYVIKIIGDPIDINNIDVLQTLNPVITVNTLTHINVQSAWQTVTIHFEYCGTVEANSILFERATIPGVTNWVTQLDNISLKIDPNPPVLAVDAGEDMYYTPSCDPVQLNATPSYLSCQMAYSWSPTTGLSDPTIPNPTASPSQTTTYTVTVTDLLTNATATDDVTVFVVPLITDFDDFDVCSDDVIDLYDLVSPDGGDFYAQSGNPTIIDDHYFDPSIDGFGSYSFLYVYGSDNCPSFGNLTINVLGFNASNATNPNGLIVANNSPNDGATLSGNLQFLDDLVIEDGAVFTLSNAQMQFAEGKGIRVHTGGKLYIKNNSHLKNLDCENNWAGIYVHGNQSYSQVPSQAYHQGQCFIENSTIENALRGITNYAVANSSTHGGIFRCLNTTFKNCEISADILDYHNTNPSNNVELPINCKFYNSTFIWDEDFQFINSQANPMIHLTSLYQVTISGCTFTNTNTGIFTYPNNSSEKAAINAYKASIVLSKGCSGLPPYAINIDGSCLNGDVTSKITGFNYGVVMLEGGSSSITKTSFNCYRGLWALSGNGFQFTQNNFGNLPQNLIPYSGQNNNNDPTWQIPYGAYLESISKFWLEGNTFNYPLTNTDAGLFIRASGPGYNNAYRNTFYKTTYGSVAYDDNRGTTGNNGLKYECNSFTGNIFSITTYPTISNPPNGWGISKVQGVAPLPNNPYGIPAGNYFNTANIYNVDNELEQVIYYTHPSENLLTYVGITPVQLNIENGCLSSFPSPFGKEGLMAGYKAEADSIENVLGTMIDDGNTPALSNEVVLADYSEAVELYYDLMEVSPNLSEDVMIEAINKEFTLPASLLTLILNSNPHAAKSGRIQKKLDDRAVPLADYQRAMIDQGLQLVSYKEKLEARESYNKNRYDFLLNQIIFEILTDTVTVDKISAIISAIQGYETVDHYYLIIDMFLKAGKVSEAQNWLNSIATDFNLDPRRDAEYSDFIAVYSILFNKATTGDTTLTQNEQNTLELIAYKHSTLASGLARVTLYGYTGIPFLETLVEPTKNPNPKSMQHLSKAPEIKECKVYPNPTAGILMIEIPEEFKEVEAMVRDANGKVVYKDLLSPGMATLNLRSLVSASYTLYLHSKTGALDETHQIQIAK